MSVITCKFGGTSLADATAIKRCVGIIRADPNRRFIVPSAPGKRTPDDKKITDLFYAWYSLARQGLDAEQPANLIRDRFRELASNLGLRFDINGYLDQIAKEAAQHDAPDFMASRGEFLMGHLLAELLEGTFVDPTECIRLDEAGRINDETYELLARKLPSHGHIVVPGFYGATPSGRIRTFSRGGSDVTGAIVARASRSTLYENWTDVPGIRMTDPRIVPNARRIEEVTYRELRELSYMGASVLHDEAIFPVIKPAIPIHIRSSLNPDQPGTMIVSERVAATPVIGIAGRKGFTMVNIEKTLMNREHGFGLRVLEAFHHFGVGFEHMPTGIDTISVICRDEELKDFGPAIVREIEQTCAPDRVTLSSGIAIIATVGQGMNHHIGVAARLCGALADARVNLRVIDQGSSEMNIIVGVEEEDLEPAVQALYDAFNGWEAKGEGVLRAHA